MGKIASALIIGTIITLVQIEICLSSPIPKADSTVQNKKAEKKGKYLLLANTNEGKSNNRHPEASLPVDEDLESLAEEALKKGASDQADVVAIPFSSGTLVTDNGSLVGDILPEEEMETAENIVFRPLFRYKKQNVERRTVYRDRNGNILNQTEKPKPQAFDKPPASDKNPPAVLVYDKVTGSYYPVPSAYGSYYPGSYPAYLRQNRQ